MTAIHAPRTQVRNAHTGNRAPVTSMGGLYDTTTLCVLVMHSDLAHHNRFKLSKKRYHIFCDTSLHEKVFCLLVWCALPIHIGIQKQFVREVRGCGCIFHHSSPRAAIQTAASAAEAGSSLASNKKMVSGCVASVPVATLALNGCLV